MKSGSPLISFQQFTGSSILSNELSILSDEASTLSDGAQDIWGVVGKGSALGVHHLGVGVVAAVVEGDGGVEESGAGRRALSLRLSH